MEFNTKRNISIPSGLEIIFHSEQRVLSCFLHSINRKLYPELIKSTTASTGFTTQNAMLFFYHEMDWEDKKGLDIGSGDVSVYVYDGKPNEIVIKEVVFSWLLYDYGMRLLEAYQDDPDLSVTWQASMSSSLSKLRNKLDDLSKNTL